MVSAPYDIKASLLLVIIRHFITLDDLSSSIYFLRILICELSDTLIVKEQDSIISWTILAADWHISLLINDSLEMIWYRTRITVTILILEDDRCIIRQNLAELFVYEAIVF